MSFEDDRPGWDDGVADAMIGAVVLIGLTWRRPEGEEQTQLYGVIQTADPENGFEIILSGAHEGETYWLPPDLSSFQPAPRGEYRLRSTGEIVVDPDYISQWTIDPPAH